MGPKEVPFILMPDPHPTSLLTVGNDTVLLELGGPFEPACRRITTTRTPAPRKVPTIVRGEGTRFDEKTKRTVKKLRETICAHAVRTTIRTRGEGPAAHT